MFKCGNCNQDTKLGQPVNYIVTERRKVSYENQVGRKEEWVLSEGFETVKEIKACPDCFLTMTGLEPRIAEARVHEKALEDQPVFKTKKFPTKPRNRREQFNPNWKFKKELDEIRRKESLSADPRGPIERKKPVVEVVQRQQKQHDRRQSFSK